MLYIFKNGTSKPVVDMLMDEMQILNMDKAKLMLMQNSGKFSYAYTCLKMKMEDCEERIANYKKMLGESNQTVGDFKPETL